MARSSPRPLDDVGPRQVAGVSRRALLREVVVGKFKVVVSAWQGLVAGGLGYLGMAAVAEIGDKDGITKDGAMRVESWDSLKGGP
ncbi:hypothetical protein Trco_007537 [Trichoderma cornu-damae]|uniref:Uncharacterized protein n=1 Tax=Trichoderma cornu-damae TaxID=654480 RepID=A0A9P8QEF4_9HYPO|nr:hypothetical protein Trco_007537 [Trichoderma cornu-damae]